MTLADMLAIHVPVKARTMRSVVVLVFVVIIPRRHRIHRGANDCAGYANSCANDSACRFDCGADQT